MERDSPPVRDWARQLLAEEANALSNVDCMLDGMERVWQKLDRHLTRLFGVRAFQSIKVQAFMLAADEYPWLKPDGSEWALSVDQVGLRERLEARDRAEVTECTTAILTHFLQVVIRLIGDDLCFRLLCRIWSNLGAPKLPPGSTQVEESHE